MSGPTTPAVKFRDKTYTGETHKDAAFKQFTEKTALRVTWRIVDGKEDIIFGYANEDGSEWVECGSQKARKEMYGFK